MGILPHFANLFFWEILFFCDHLKTYKNPKRITNQSTHFADFLQTLSWYSWSIYSLDYFLKTYGNLAAFCKSILLGNLVFLRPSKNLRKSVHVLPFLMVKTILFKFSICLFLVDALAGNRWRKPTFQCGLRIVKESAFGHTPNVG